LQEAHLDKCASSCGLDCTLLSVAISALQGCALYLFAVISRSPSMAVCGKNGGSCYWAHCRRLPGKCTNCMWTPPDGCHPTRLLCATCFEERADQAFAAKPMWEYPACLATFCREQSRAQAVKRDLAMDLVPWYSVSPFPPSGVMRPSWGPPPGLPAGSSSANMYCTASPASGLSFSTDRHSLADTVAGLQDAVLQISRKADAIMDLMEQIERSISLIPKFQPLCL
jgi:hypothetical protein